MSLGTNVKAASLLCSFGPAQIPTPEASSMYQVIDTSKILTCFAQLHTFTSRYESKSLTRCFSDPLTLIMSDFVAAQRMPIIVDP